MATSPPLKTDSVPVPTPPEEPHQAEATPRQPQQLPQPQLPPSLSLDWPAAYPRCPIFGIPYQATASRQGEVVQVEVQHRRYNLRFIPPFLQICVNGTWLIYVPQFPELLAHVLYGNHDHVTAGLQGQKKTDLSLRRWYYWLGMRAYTTAYVESCAQCRASKPFNQKTTGLVQQLMIPSRRWSHVSLYFMDLPRTTSGNDAIVILVDSLSTMADFIPTKKAVTTADTVKVLADRLIRYHGFPDTLMLDRDQRFQSELWSQLCSHFNITKAMSSSYHLQTDGQTERVNRTLEQVLRTYIQADERELEGLLPALELAYNTTPHSTTELSPIEVVIGGNPVTPADLDIIGALSPTLTPPVTKPFR